MTDEQLKQMMSSRYELDPSGRINVSNPQNARLIQADTNRDGFVDMAEYRVYVASRMNGGGGMNGMNGGGMTMGGQNPQGMNGGQPGGGWSGGPPGGWSGGPPQSGFEKGNRNNKKDDDEEKPVVYRFGNMPKEVPSWFEQYDTDKDGQIGLYEWRSAGKRTDEFEEYDLNSDGYITADEWLRKQKMDTAKRDDDERMSKPVGSSNANARSGMGSRGSFGNSGSPGGGGSSGRNPFTGAGGAAGGPSGGGGPSRGDRGTKGEMSSAENTKKGEKKQNRGPKE